VDATDMGNDLKEILVTAEDMDRRLAEMAEQIDRDYAGEDLLLVGVLRGAVMVMADLSRKLHTPLEMDWMAVSSYGSGEAAKVDVDVAYVGFDIPDEFVVGYGLDYAEKYRNMPFVGTLQPHVYTN